MPAFLRYTSGLGWMGLLVLWGAAACECAYAQRVEPGPHPVGFRVQETVLSVDSGDGADGARLPVHLWYPAQEATGHPMPYGDYLALTQTHKRGSLGPSTDADRVAARDLPQGIARHGLKRPLTDAQWQAIYDRSATARRDADPAPGPFPLVLGGLNGAQSVATLAEHLASHGYVVASGPVPRAVARQQRTAPLQAVATSSEILAAVLEVASSRSFVDTSRIGLVGVNFDGYTVLDTQMRTGLADAIVTLDGREGKIGGAAITRSLPHFDPERLRVPYLALLMDAPDEPRFHPDEAFFETLQYADWEAVVLDGVEHFHYIGDLLAWPHLRDEVEPAYAAIYDRVLRFLDVHVQASSPLRVGPARTETTPYLPHVADRAAVAQATAVLNALGGRERWASLASLYIRAVHTEPHLDAPYRSEIWRDVGVPRVRIEQQGTRRGAPFHSIRLLSGAGAWSIRDGVAEPMAAAAQQALLHWNAHLVYATLQTLARGGPDVGVQLDDAGRLVVLQDGALLGRMTLDEHDRPVVYATPALDGSGESRVRYTAWSTSAEYVHPIVSEPEGSGAIFRTEVWQPSPAPSMTSFVPEIDQRGVHSQVRRLTDNDATDFHPSWSPDGTALLFDSDEGGASSIHTLDLASGLIRRVGAGDHPYWLPGGDRVTAVQARLGGVEVVALLALDGALVQTVSAAQGRNGAGFPSPDGRHIAYLADRDGDWDLFVAPVAGGPEQRLTDTDADEFFSSWSPDGRALTYQSDASGNWDLFTLRLDGDRPFRLTDHPAHDTSLRWSPDGTVGAFISTRDGTGDLYLMDADGSAVRRLTESAGDADWHQWAPDGTHLAYAVTRADGTATIWVVHVASGVARPLVDHPSRNLAPAWSPDGRRLVFASDRDGDFDLYLLDLPRQDSSR